MSTSEIAPRDAEQVEAREDNSEKDISKTMSEMVRRRRREKTLDFENPDNSEKDISKTMSEEERRRRDRLSEDPDEAWSVLKAKQEFLPPAISPAYSEKPEGSVRFVAISDTHGKHDMLKDIPYGDVLVHCGDFTMNGGQEVVDSFNKWLGKLPHKHKVVIAGNHDISFHEEFFRSTEGRGRARKDSAKDDPKQIKKSFTNAIYLEDAEVVLEGVKIYGSPWQPEFCDWAFNLPRGAPIREKWEAIPEDTDVLLTHGPPLGRGDKVQPSGARAGCLDLLMEIQKRVKPQYNVFGHIHEGYGASSDGVTTFVNASSLDIGYHVDGRPIVFDVVPKK